MLQRSFLLTAILALNAAAADVDAKGALANASKALGADGLKSIEYSGSGFDFVLGQNFNANSPWPRFNNKTYTRLVSFEPWATRLQRIRTQAENPPRGGGQQPIIGDQNQVQVVAPGTPAAATLADELMMTLPQAFVRIAAAASDVTAKAESKAGKKYTVVSFTAINKAKTSGWINDQNLVERVETMIDNNVYGDIAYEVTFADYKALGGIQFPTHIVQKQGGYPVLDWTVSEVKTNVPANISAPAAPAAGAPPAAAASEKLGDGVYLITGGYAALAVDMKDHILIIEGGQSDQRSQAVMAEAKRLIPGKPITEMVNTHSHVDHAGGVRAYVAEGATIITHELNKPYFEKIWKTPHTLAPDALAKSPKKASFKTVKDKMVITDGDHVVELHRMTDFGHHDAMLLVYLPKEKVLVEADGFNPPAREVTQTPATISPYNQSLVANIERLKLDVQRIIPIHLPADGRKVGMAELFKVIGRT
jgi:glyoxylase-like metal-dependent hydrolase (beta-lactamase superfamily II)